MGYWTNEKINEYNQLTPAVKEQLYKHKDALIRLYKAHGTIDPGVVNRRWMTYTIVKELYDAKVTQLSFRASKDGSGVKMWDLNTWIKYAYIFISYEDSNAKNSRTITQ